MSNEIEKARDSLAMIERERQRRDFTEFHLARTERFNQEIQLLREENKRLRSDLKAVREMNEVLSIYCEPPSEIARELAAIQSENAQLKADLAQARQTIEDVCCGAKE